MVNQILLTGSILIAANVIGYMFYRVFYNKKNSVNKTSEEIKEEVCSEIISKAFELIGSKTIQEFESEGNFKYTVQNHTTTNNTPQGYNRDYTKETMEHIEEIISFKFDNEFWCKLKISKSTNISGSITSSSITVYDDKLELDKVSLNHALDKRYSLINSIIQVFKDYKEYKKSLHDEQKSVYEMAKKGSINQFLNL